MKVADFVKHIQSLLAKNELKEALQQFRLFSANSPMLNEVLQQSGRHASIKSQIRMGTINFDDATIEENKVRVALLEMLDELSAKESDTTLQAEINKVAQDYRTIIQNAEKIYNIDHIDTANFN